MGLSTIILSHQFSLKKFSKKKLINPDDFEQKRIVSEVYKLTSISSSQVTKNLYTK